MVDGQRRSAIERAAIIVASAYGGGLVMMLEILGTRLMAPVLGSGLYVWTAQITSAMLGLAAGYALGGRIAARAAPRRVRRVLVWAIAAVALWLLVLPFFARSLLGTVTGLDLRAAALLCSSLLLGPPMLALGMLTPLVVAIWARDSSAPGGVVGRVLAISTFGSLVGALLTAFILLPNVPTSVSLRVASALAWALASVLALLNAELSTALVMVSGVILTEVMLGASQGPAPPGLVHRALGHGIEIKVVDHGDNRYFLVDGAGQTAIDRRTGECTYDYTAGLERLKQAHPGAQSALLIGLGGGCMIRRLAPLAVDVVEVDPVVPEVAAQYFQVAPASYRLHVADGRAFLVRTDRRWSVIVIDAFAADVPACHLFSREAFEAMRRRLEPGGVVMLNTLTSDGPRGRRFGERLAATMRAAFGTVEVHASPSGPFGYSNLILLASERALPGASAASSSVASADLFLDDFNDCDIQYGLETGLRTRPDDWASWGLATLVYE